MFRLPGSEPIDYLAIGHITENLTSRGMKLGGSVSYAALTAQALGLRAGIVTSFNQEMALGRLSDIPIISSSAEKNTTFENIYLESGRRQKLHYRAKNIEIYEIPNTWRKAKIVHAAPVAGEVGMDTLRQFQDSFLCLTPQGWMREWDAEGKVVRAEWPEADFALGCAEAVVISEEDVGGDESLIAQMAAASRVLVVTKGRDGATLYLNGEIHHFEAPQVVQVDPTGAGDIFAAAFFGNLYSSGDALGAARFANQVASISVTRRGLAGVPSKDEIYDLMTEVR